MTQPNLPDNIRALDENGAVIRGNEPAPATTVMRHMIYGSGLTHSLDYVVLLHTLFRLEENRPFTPADIWQDLKGQGIQSAKDSKKLVGRDAVYEAFNRLITANFIRRTSDAARPGRFGPVRYELYRQPSYNPDRSPLPGTPEADKADSKTAGQTASRNAGSGVPVSGVPGSGARSIPAGQPTSGVPGSGNAAPPTPPYREEEDSSSRKSSSTTAVPADAQATDATAVMAATEFLAELPGRWACGRKTAAELAPLLAEAAQEQGWELGTALAQHLTRRASARRTSQSMLRERIEDLPRYRAARRALEQERSAAGRVPGQQLALEDTQHGRGDSAAPLLDVSPERVEQAREFLLTLSGPWVLGPEAAVRLAPLLVVKAAERGWTFDEQLRQQLMSNPGGGQNYEWLLENRRIATLPDRTRHTSGGLSRQARDARQKAIDACGVCDSYGQFERNGAVVLCRHDEAEADIAPEQGGVPAPASEAEHEERRPDVPRAPGNLADLLASMRKSPV
ncbi:hypothetical protein STHAL_32310 [Streptomyces halstedii]|uniref:Helix-turn-helix domain-containing protein n=1 Tax=Streptomyces halstedii TaxID=1944 RepID=A0ABS6U0R4_STRHA|nr:hypothetical protein [Streptomyces halstedii]MBV7674132.1 hypothetical protein [Streptomyces halstedii]